MIQIPMHPAVSLSLAFGLLLLSLHLHAILPCHAATTDTISPGQELTGGDKLLSSNGRFALGFFQTGSNLSHDDTNPIKPKWYLGIWFHTVPKFTPVWVANAENPVANLASCKLLLSRDDGNLVMLSNNRSTAIWSSNATATATATSTTTASLLDNGNLVLHSASNASDIFWQSFDHPTDTILQGAKIGWSNATGLTSRLVSRKNAVDQTPGLYSFQLLLGQGGHTSIVSMYNSSNTYWSSGDWGGRYFSNIPETVGQTWLSLNFTSSEQGTYIEYAVEDPTVLSRGTVDVSGQMNVLVWFEGSQDWQTIYTAPKSQCDVYASCGPFTICGDVPSPPAAA